MQMSPTNLKLEDQDSEKFPRFTVLKSAWRLIKDNFIAALWRGLLFFKILVFVVSKLWLRVNLEDFSLDFTALRPRQSDAKVDCLNFGHF